MITTLPTNARNILFGIISLVSVSTAAQTTSIPFNCDFNAYLFQYNDVYAIDLASGNSILVASDVTPGNINGAGYNAKDGYIWGFLSSPDKSIVRIGKNFQTDVFEIPEIASGNKYVGDVSPSGIYYLKAGGATYYTIDLDPASTNYTKYIGSGSLSESISCHDWAFNAADGQLYTVEQKTNILFRINPVDGVVTNLGVVPIIAGKNYTYGAVYFDLDGSFYISSNQTGTVYVIRSVQNLTSSSAISSNLFAFGPSSSSNDGARCPTAPVPQEICDNGIDDDGDGLIDCEDPSCSGFGNCAVVDESVSGGNDGGLESNGRLSELINQRNYNRVKTAYKFDKTTAKKVTKASKTAKTATGNTALRDFIPFQVINENSVIESTPTDLIAITNATEVYSVDYIRNNKTVASILALKTDNGVYEHTKFICDRLLGAQIISVSTMDIGEQPFIKTIIKNADGTIEYVLSIAVRETNAGVNYAVECHWNLDKYTTGVGYLNYQIWSNSIDDLYSLADEVVTLINAKKEISEYKVSSPPTVFVRKGTYSDGNLVMQVVNTNATTTVAFTSGKRTTETSTEESFNQTINLDGKYISELTVPVGNLFDVGFRIGDGIATPDDLFMSDGPWGVDAAAASTTVSNYQITANTEAFGTNVRKVERNLNLSATTSKYIAAYRALTPRFQPVDLSAYKGFHFKGKGTGLLEIVFVKNSISNWEEQYRTTVVLTNDYQDFSIPIAALTSTMVTPQTLNDVKTIVFKMTAADGQMTTKTMDLQTIQFSVGTTLEVAVNPAIAVKSAYVAPNPLTEQSTINFTSEVEEAVSIKVYNVLGKVVKSYEVAAKVGANQVTISKAGLGNGIYFCKLNSPTAKYNVIKMLVK
ncbi:hypothetical protein FFWV33_09500 [Flavobacterium faecale]|uniref:Uncharacterized protein n=1 Tax=Flavobacterium faecale TaxID=1355330 RepID=A0A2S1LDD5_9FLAO|nr:T9SS type A sorting domain-containing protein [Flavobacterium faecale]AWG21759.1 hypothetical protein FFWV33_09500 [Flavobacterium faecale]